MYIYVKTNSLIYIYTYVTWVGRKNLTDFCIPTISWKAPPPHPSFALLISIVQHKPRSQTFTSSSFHTSTVPCSTQEPQTPTTIDNGPVNPFDCTCSHKIDRKRVAVNNSSLFFLLGCVGRG